MTTAIRCIATVGLLLAVCGPGARQAPAADSEGLRQRQQAQEAARSQAADLVSAVLDLQLRQLEENGLAELPIYRDVRAMRENVSGLIADEMSHVVRLLGEAQTARPDTAEAKWKEARQAIREVVAGLMAERQKLHRRMQVSRLAAEARELVAQQQQASGLVRSLPELATDGRERAALTAIEAQADVREVYRQLLVGLEDVSHWGGASAAGAVDGLRVLRVYEVERQLQLATEALGQASFSAAGEAQRSALTGLAALVERLERLEGLSNADREAALRLIEELIARQRELREACRAAALTEETAPPLVERQTALHAELVKLPLALAKYPTTAPLAEEAKAASFEATARLFEAQQASSLDQQSRVITSLAQIARLLEQGLDGPLAGRSADDWAVEVERLGKLAALLAQASASPTEAGAILERASELGEFSSIVEARLDAAQEAARQADGSASLEALRLAEAETAMELADARRKHKAVEVGELARAAEALERASAAERTVGRQLQMATTTALSAEQLEMLAAEHTDVATVAERIAAGLQHTAPAAAKQLLAAQGMFDQTAALLEKVAPAVPTAPGIASDVASQTSGAAAKLAEAAATIRVAQAAAAKRLEEIAGEQFQEATAAREAASAALERQAPSRGEALAYLLEARWQLIEALANQARAEGKPTEAKAQLALREVRDIVALQEQAEEAARDLASGRTASPLDAAAAQQAVAERARKLAADAGGPLADSLNSAAAAAGGAGRALVAGRSTQTEEMQIQSREALNAALAAATSELERETKSPIGRPDAAAQAKIADDLTASREAALAGGVAGAEAAALLDQARQRAAAVSKAMAAGSPDAADLAQVRALLDQSAQALDRAIEKLAGEESVRLARQAADASQLINQAGKVDAGAATALAQAVMAGQERSAEHTDALGVSRALARVQSKLEQAGANLAEREQQLKRDRDLAHLLAEFAEDQQEARESIVKAAAEFEKMTEADSVQRLMAAQALLQAQQRFVQTLIATGEGAAELSGQEEVANQPIREGLAIASGLGNLGAESDGKEAGEGQPGEGKAGEGDKGEPAAGGREGTNKKGQAGEDARFVPAQPQKTAEQIAGPAASAQAAQSMAQAAEAAGQGQPGEGQSQSESSQEGATAAAPKKGGATKGSKTAKNESPPAGDLETADAEDSDSRATGMGDDAVAGAASAVQNEAWFARLPADVRAAIQARARAKAPRGYEERLRRYFESVD